MICVLSVTSDSDLYLFNLPFAVYSWRKLGFEPLILWTSPNLEYMDRWQLVLKYCYRFMDYNIWARDERAATYAQCSRLYAAAIHYIRPDDILVTADADMCVFDRPYWDRLPNKEKVFHIIGYDLVPDGQVPMCYIMAPAREWNKAMNMGAMGINECLERELGHIQTDNMRGNYWCKDQELAYNHIMAYAKSDDAAAPVWLHRRARPGTQLANRRADRDGWPDPIPDDILDAHLPRPGYLPENFSKIAKLFKSMYPGADLEWMAEYYNKYIELIK